MYAIMYSFSALPSDAVSVVVEVRRVRVREQHFSWCGGSFKAKEQG